LLLLKNATVISCATSIPLENVNVTMDGGRIIDISKTHIETADSLDCTGCFVIPGLWDMHTHMVLYGEECLEEMVACGVTGARDMGGDFDLLNEWRRDIAGGTRIGPRIFSAGVFIDGPKKMRPDRALATIVVETELQARNAVLQTYKRGVDFIKVHSRLPRAAFLAVVDESKRLGLDVAVHLPATVTIEDIISAGIHSLEHADAFLEECPYIEDELLRSKTIASRFEFLQSRKSIDLLQRFVDSATWFTPTIVPFATVFKDQGTEIERALPGMLIEITNTLNNLGSAILAGSDFAWPEIGIKPGVSLHTELGLLVKAGLTPVEALQSATRNAAQCLHKDQDFGTVEIGKVADLVVLGGNPLTDIGNVSDIRSVVLSGKVI
jgi:imidazolonepropionase-like amidohydrolase